MLFQVPFAYTPKLTSEARFLMPAELEPKLVDYIDVNLSVLPEPPAINIKLEQAANKIIRYRKDDDIWRRPLALGRYGMTGISSYDIDDLKDLIRTGYVPAIEADNLWGSRTLLPSPQITTAYTTQIMLKYLERQYSAEVYQKKDRTDCIDYESSKNNAVKMWSNLNLALCQDTMEIFYETSEPVIVLDKKLPRDIGFELVPSESRMAQEAKSKYIFAYNDWDSAAKLLQEKNCSLGYKKNPIAIDINEGFGYKL